MTVRDLLLRSYPRAWRAEFGPEMADILANKKLSAALISDIVASAALQHFRQDPWKICAVGLLGWTAVVLTFANKRPANAQPVLWCYFAGQLLVFTAGAWTGLRKHCGIWRATAAALKSAVVPAVACMTVNTFAVLPYRGPFEWIWKKMAMLAIVAFAFGAAGATLGRFVQAVRAKP